MLSLLKIFLHLISWIYPMISTITSFASFSFPSRCYSMWNISCKLILVIEFVIDFLRTYSNIPSNHDLLLTCHTFPHVHLYQLEEAKMRPLTPPFFASVPPFHSSVVSLQTLSTLSSAPLSLEYRTESYTSFTLIHLFVRRLLKQFLTTLYTSDDMAIHTFQNTDWKTQVNSKY